MMDITFLTELAINAILHAKPALIQVTTIAKSAQLDTLMMVIDAVLVNLIVKNANHQHFAQNAMLAIY